jgi:DNA-binding response OmpR family regulator
MILVADGDITFLDLASQILNRDRQVFLAFDAQQAFLLAKHLGFLVALVDLDLKGKDGLLLIQQLRDAFRDLPVIAVSAALTSNARKMAKDLGAVELLQKPITPEWKPVVERIRRLKHLSAD